MNDVMGGACAMEKYHPVVICYRKPAIRSNAHTPTGFIVFRSNAIVFPRMLIIKIAGFRSARGVKTIVVLVGLISLTFRLHSVLTQVLRLPRRRPSASLLPRRRLPPQLTHQFPRRRLQECPIRRYRRRVPPAVGVPRP